MTLRTKLLASPAPLAVVLVLLGVASVKTLRSLGESPELILKDNYRSVLATERMIDVLGRLQQVALEQAAGRPPTTPAAELRKQFDQELEVQEHNITEAGEEAATATLRDSWQRYLTGFESVLALPQPERLRAHFERLEPLAQEVRRSTRAILDLNQDAMVRKSDRARRAAERSVDLVVFATLAALALGLVSSLALTARLLRPLGVLSQTVRRLGEGDLEARTPRPGKGRDRGLAQEFNAMAEQLAEYRRSSLGELLQAQQAAQAAIDSLPDPVLVLDAAGAILNLNGAAEQMLRLGSGATLESLDPELRRGGGAGAAARAGRPGAVPAPGLRRGGPGLDHRGQPPPPAARRAPLLRGVGDRGGHHRPPGRDPAACASTSSRTTWWPRWRTSSARRSPRCAWPSTCAPRRWSARSPRSRPSCIGAARDECERLQGIVDDLLDLSRIQAGRMELRVDRIGASALLSVAADALRKPAEDAGLSLQVEEPESEVLVRADPERVGLVLANLIANAVRHTPRGGTITMPCTGRRCGGAVRGVRHRRGNPPRAPGAHLREVLPGAGGTRRRGRARPLHRARDRPGSWWRHGRGEHAGAWEHLLVHAAAGTGRTGRGSWQLDHGTTDAPSGRETRRSCRGEP